MAKKKADLETTEQAAEETKSEKSEKPVFNKTNPRLTALLASDLIKKINKQAGGLAIAMAADREAKSKRIPSGIFGLDCALGGGWLVGGVHTLYGPESGGKTTNILRAIAQAQRLCGNCWTGDIVTEKCDCGDFRQVAVAYIDVEGTLDTGWAQQIGVNVNAMLISTPEYAEQSLDILEALLRTGEVDVIALDSLAFLTPAKEIEESTAKETMGIQPRVIGKGIRKLVAAMNAMELISTKRRPTIFFTNQIRMQLGVMFGNPETTSGGKAPRFAATTEVRLAAGKYEIPEGGIGKPVSVTMRFKVEKNKSAVPKIEGEYVMALSEIESKKLGDIMDEQEIVRISEKLGLLTGGGSSWTFLEDETFKGKTAFEAKLMYDPIYRANTAKLVMHAFLKN
jgi:recombination protein RecA